MDDEKIKKIAKGILDELNKFIDIDPCGLEYEDIIDIIIKKLKMEF